MPTSKTPPKPTARKYERVQIGVAHHAKLVTEAKARDTTPQVLMEKLIDRLVPIAQPASADSVIAANARKHVTPNPKMRTDPR